MLIFCLANPRPVVISQSTSPTSDGATAEREARAQRQRGGDEEEASPQDAVAVRPADGSGIRSREGVLSAGLGLTVCLRRLPKLVAATYDGADTQPVTTVYVIDGMLVTSLEDFYRVLGEAITGPGGYFGGNLDALDGCLRGGFGTPDDDDFVIEWRDHAISRQHLGYPETVRQLELRLRRCHPSNRECVAAELEEARAERGPTVFDWLVEIVGTYHRKLRLA